MTDSHPDVWTTRDYPVLTHVAEALEIDGEDEVRPETVAATLQIAPQDATRSLASLMRADPPYVEGRNLSTYGGDHILIERLTERGRRTVGMWPSGDSAEALIEALELVADQTGDPDEQGRLRKAAEAVGRVGRDVMVEVIGAALARGMVG